LYYKRRQNHTFSILQSIQSNMTTLRESIDLLPKELRIMIANYNVHHRVDYISVMNELTDVCTIVYCDNPLCDSVCRKYEAIHVNISVNSCYFCSDRCLDIGEGEIEHAIYKSRISL